MKELGVNPSQWLLENMSWLEKWYENRKMITQQVVGVAPMQKFFCPLDAFMPMLLQTCVFSLESDNWQRRGNALLRYATMSGFYEQMNRLPTPEDTVQLYAHDEVEMEFEGRPFKYGYYLLKA